MGVTPEIAAKDTIRRLRGTWHGSYGKARCPAHDDRKASLSVIPGDKAVLFKCFAGCTSEAILAALRRGHAFIRADEPTERPLQRRDLRGLCREIWSRALPIRNTPAEKYLVRRGIAHSTIAKFDPAAIVYEEGKQLRLPGLILPIIENRELVALSRILLAADGQKSDQLADPKRTLGDPRGGAVQIGQIENGNLNLAEGFEDAESAIKINGLAGCWSVSGIEQYNRLAIPNHVRRITIYSQHGIGAARVIEKARPHLTKNDRSLEIVMPPPGVDWNEALLAGVI
jgi:hypothetical protein